MSLTYHPPLNTSQGVYFFDHLKPITFSTPSEKLHRDVVTWCRFTTHTFSRKPLLAEAPDCHDEANKPRMFCPDRYELSRLLPGLIKAMRDAHLYVWQTAAERNWMYAATVSVGSEAGRSTDYQVFFSVKKAPRLEPFDVEMTVESAYPHDPARVPKLLGRMKIAGVLTATIEGRHLHTAGARKR